MYKKKWIFSLIAPGFIVFAIVVLVPTIMGILLSFTNWQAGKELFSQGWIGFDNYRDAFQDQEFVNAIGYTLLFTFISAIFINFFGFGLAFLLNLPFKGKNIFRSAFFLPNLIGGLIIGYLWKIMFDEFFTYLFGGETLRLSSQYGAMIALAIVTAWQYSGYVMVIYLAGLQNVNKSLWETSKIEGINWWAKFRNVILPAVAPAITIAIFITIKSSFKMFDKNLSLTEGTNNSSLIALNIWRSALDKSLGLTYGVAQAKSFIFTILVSAIAITQVHISKKFEVKN